MQNYVAIYTLKGKYITLLNLKDIAENLDEKLFMRVHKSYIIAISKIDTVESHEIKIESTCIPLSRNYRGEIDSAGNTGKIVEKVSGCPKLDMPNPIYK